LTAQKGLISWSSSDSINTITDFYQEQFKSNSWQITQPFNADDNTLVAQKDNLEVKLSFLSSSDGNTDYSLSYQPINSPTISTNQEQ
jgi:hypothetical protein